MFILNRLFALTLAATLGFASACASLPHKTLTTAPTAEDSYEERARYYREHTPALVNFSSTGYLLLHGGTQLYYPEDLRPAVDPDSPTARAIDAHVPARESAQAFSDWVSMPSMVVALVGGLAASAAFPLALNSTNGDFGGTFTDPLLLGSTGVFVLGLGGIVAGGLLTAEPSRVANESLVTIRATYPQSLEDRVRIHADGDGKLVDTAPAPQPGGLGTREVELQI